MAIETILIFDAASFLNAAGQQGFDDDTNNAGVIGSGPFKLVNGNPQSVQIDDQENGTPANFLNDGTTRDQYLDAPVDLTYVQDGVTRTTTFPAGTTQVQGEFTITFSSGYTLVAIRLTDPLSATTGDTLVNAGYALVPPVGGSVPPPYDPITGEFILGSVTGTSNNGATPYGDIPCFVAGTLIATPTGPVRVEDLREGHLVQTVDNGSVVIVWTGAQMVTFENLKAHPHLAPIEFASGCLGNVETLQVSPQHRLVLDGPLVDLWFGEPQMLAPAAAWLGTNGVRQVMPEQGVRYIHFACAGHELVLANGALAETLLPAAGSATHLARMLEDFDGEPAEYGASVRPILRMFEAQTFIHRDAKAA